MVLLTMTPAIVATILKCQELDPESLIKFQLPSEPSLAEPEVGNPISHSQLIDISKLVKNHPGQINLSPHLDGLLRGSKIYTPPTEPKPEPTSEYKALMARLRKEEEARAYERMLSPVSSPKSSIRHYPTIANASLYSTAVDRTEDEDEVTYADVNRQIILIINVLISIVACSVFIWIAARHWSTPKRLGLSMAGSGVIAVAEVVIYGGYVRRVQEAKQREKKKPEIKSILESWVIDGASEKENISMKSPADKSDETLRHRKGKHR
ncbi:hypothetical protein AOQ84DRAFT_228440 [Glonium stellatum]|uniref:Uncharacterized protein n=1 Tax=Glonium stellatum TaxID=574774 RepID=A0A8E2JN32_9PEZI|nr:hypothetical protein AOQ84DRAFT_228440 [Glonium stellatum]